MPGGTSRQWPTTQHDAAHPRGQPLMPQHRPSPRLDTIWRQSTATATKQRLCVMKIAPGKRHSDSFLLMAECGWRVPQKGSGLYSARSQQKPPPPSSLFQRAKKRVSPLAPSASHASAHLAVPSPPQNPTGRLSLAEKSPSSQTMTPQDGSMQAWYRPFYPHSTLQQPQSALSFQTSQSEATS